MSTIPHTDTLHIDGYRVNDRTPLHNPDHVLHMELFVGGDCMAETPVYQSPRDCDGTAAFTRATLLLEAICRYKNAGGTTDELVGLMDVLEKLPDISLPPEVGQLVCSVEVVERCDYYRNADGEYWRSRLDDFSEPISDAVMAEFVEREQLPVYVERG